MDGLMIFEIAILIIYFIIFIASIFQIKKKKQVKKILLTSILLIALTTQIEYFVYYKYTIPLLNIKGDSIVEVEVFSEYKDAGYELEHPNKDLKVKVTSNVDTEKVGIYDVTYSVKHIDDNITQSRKVKVVDNEKPVIELIGEEEIILLEDAIYKESGYKANDNYDKDITDKVKITNNIKNDVGEYEVIYTVSDSSGNTYSIKRKVKRIKSNKGIIYLTFDDGPSSTTPKVLDILKKENIKATFFVVNFSSEYEPYIKRIVNEGHTIALHSYTHNYKLIYSSENAYFDDLNKLKEKVKNITGIDSYILRFPGGSSNTISSFNKGIMTYLTKKVKESGYHYFDWNVDSRDAGGAKNSDAVYNNVMKNLNPNRNNIVLMHDFANNNKTVDALERIIKDAKNKGYKFSNITYNTPMVTHGVNN